MAERHESTQQLSIDGGPPVEARLNELRPDAWVAGPIPIQHVDVNRDGHTVLITAGVRVGEEATAGHGISTADKGLVFLNGKEAFEPVEGDANQAAARIVRKATEGK